MPAKLEEDVLVEGQVDESLLAIGACIKLIRFGDDSKRALSLWVDCPNVSEDALIGIIVGRGNIDLVSMMYALMSKPLDRYREISGNVRAKIARKLEILNLE